MNGKEFGLHLHDYLIPFWKNLRDDTHGGYYGWLGYDLKLDPEAEKGCILNSRILWFFSTAYSLLGDESLLDEARYSFNFLTGHCIDDEYGGVYWSVTHDGQPLDATKHTYNQAFAIYALSAYYDASRDPRALSLAEKLFALIEEKCRDSEGYLEAFTRDFRPESNEKLSENGVMAERTMNTLLHVMEGYTRLYQAAPSEKVEQRLRWIVDTVAGKLYNPRLHRQEVFFDLGYRSLIDLHSYGHDIETSWLLDRTLEALNDPALTERTAPITRDLARQVYEVAFDGRSFANECENGVVNEHRVGPGGGRGGIFEPVPENRRTEIPPGGGGHLGLHPGMPGRQARGLRVVLGGRPQRPALPRPAHRRALEVPLSQWAHVHGSDAEVKPKMRRTG